MTRMPVDVSRFRDAAQWVENMRRQQRAVPLPATNNPAPIDAVLDAAAAIPELPNQDIFAGWRRMLDPRWDMQSYDDEGLSAEEAIRQKWRAGVQGIENRGLNPEWEAEADIFAQRGAEQGRAGLPRHELMPTDMFHGIPKYDMTNLEREIARRSMSEADIQRQMTASAAEKEQLEEQALRAAGWGGKTTKQIPYSAYQEAALQAARGGREEARKSSPEMMARRKNLRRARLRPDLRAQEMADEEAKRQDAMAKYQMEMEAWAAQKVGLFNAMGLAAQQGGDTASLRKIAEGLTPPKPPGGGVPMPGAPGQANITEPETPIEPNPSPEDVVVAADAPNLTKIPQILAQYSKDKSGAAKAAAALAAQGIDANALRLWKRDLSDWKDNPMDALSRVPNWKYLIPFLQGFSVLGELFGEDETDLAVRKANEQFVDDIIAAFEKR
jgi:hypothetical protein